MRIAILGYSGSGKSTLAKVLGERYGYPVLHLDQVYFLPGWQARPVEEARAMVSAFMAQPHWVIDGNYTQLLQAERLEKADKIIFLNLPRRVCLPQAYGRYLKNKGTVRDSAAPGCPEKFDLEFLMWILRDGRKASTKARYRAIEAQYPEKFIMCRTRRDVKRLNLTKL